jgi:hypothetical protein
MIRLRIGYAEGNERALRHARTGQRALRGMGFAPEVGPAEAAELDSNEIDLWVSDGSDALSEPEGAAVACIGARVASAPVMLTASSQLRPDQPAVVWADEPAWAVQWQAQHPAHLVHVRAGTVSELRQGLGSAADALVVGQDRLQPGETYLPCHLLTPMGRGLPIWWCRPTDRSLPDLLWPMHHLASAIEWTAEAVLHRMWAGPGPLLGSAEHLGARLKLTAGTVSVRGWHQAFGELLLPAAEAGALDAACNVLAHQLVSDLQQAGAGQ